MKRRDKIEATIVFSLTVLALGMLIAHVARGKHPPIGAGPEPTPP